MSVVAKSPSGPDDDMMDTLQERERWPNVGAALDCCNERLGAIYLAADKAAKDSQRSNNHWVVATAFLATLAILLALAELRGFDKHWLLGTELGVAFFALVFFFVTETMRRRWFVERHRAERCRLLKFEFLTHPGSWPVVSETRLRWLQKRVREIQSIRDQADVRAWLRQDNVDRPALSVDPRIPVTVLRDLKAYYLAKRLTGQERYFDRQAARIENRDDLWRKVPFLLFIGSVAAVFVHVIIVRVASPTLVQATVWPGTTLGDIATVAMLMSAVSPIVGSGLRTWLSSREGSRNMTRYRAKRDTLHYFTRQLKKEQYSDDMFQEMWCCEQVIESDHREWLRLMTEAEWFG